jgi:hypothetical protein
MWTSFSRMSFRWGGGAYAGLGAEMRFNSGWGGFANFEYDAFGFTSPMAMYQSYFGPSYSFGIQRFF